MAESLTQAAADLYALPPADFTAARDELARQARSAGQRDDAAVIKKLARPTVSAWLVNQLVRAAQQPMRRLYELGEALHAAQQELAGDRLRELSAQRRQLIAELMPEVSRLAADSGVTASGSALDEVRATLEAALADEGAREAVRSGQLTRALRYAGLGEVDLAAALAVVPPVRGGTGPARAPAVAAGAGQAGAGKAGASKAGASKADSDGKPGAAAAGAGKPGPGRATPAAAAAESAAERARRDLAEAEAEVAAAAQRLADAENQIATVSERRQFHGRRVAQLRAELDGAEAEGRELARAARDAQRVRDAAARAVERADRMRTQARQRARNR